MKTSAAAEKKAVRSGEDEAIPAEVLAAIAAAAAAFLGTNFRMGSVQLRHSPREQVSQWTRQGRASIQASHNLRTKR